MSNTKRSHRPPVTDSKLASERRKRRRERKRADRKRERMAVEKAGRYGERSCGMKARYDTIQAAMTQADRIRALYSTGGLTQTAYRCSICGGWHLTSHPWEDEDGPLGRAAEEAAAAGL